MTAENHPALTHAQALAAAGRWAAVEACCRDLLAAAPRHPEANRLLGFALHAQGRPEQAIEPWSLVIAAAPASAEDRFRLAGLLAQAGRHADAITHAERCLELVPGFAPAMLCRATSLLTLGNPQAARAGFECYLRLRPDDPGGHNNLGLTHLADQRHALALEAFDRAVGLHPGYARAHNNRAVALLRLRRFAEAVEAARRAVELEPRYVKALITLGSAQRALGLPAAAVESYARAFPDPEALAEASQTLLFDLARGAEAQACARRLYELAPQRDDVAGLYHHCSQYLADWTDHDARVAVLVEGLRAGRRPTAPLRFLYAADSPAEQQLCARAFARRYAAAPPLWQGEPYRHDRIRIAYLSADFRRHATAHLMAGLFERHDRDRFEFYGIAHGTAPTSDPMRRRIEAAFEHFIDVDSRSVREAAGMLRDLEIDILVDLKGYTADSRVEILSHRPAPVQVHYLGYPGTLGAPFVDYLIADRHLIPVESRPYYDERIVYLPHSYQVNDDRRPVETDFWTRERAGLPPQGPVLCAFHQTCKLNPSIFDVWMRLLDRLPTATLWLLERDPAVAARLTEAAATRGIESRRLVFAPHLPQHQHIGRLRLADLFLDTLPYGAHTTASDALWAGLPLVAVRGRCFAARVSASILEAAGFPELVTDSLDEYEALIYDLSANPARIDALRHRLHSCVRRSSLFDTSSFARHLEHAYTAMWERSQGGLPPADIAVPLANAS